MTISSDFEGTQESAQEVQSHSEINGHNGHSLNGHSNGNGVHVALSCDIDIDPATGKTCEQRRADGTCPELAPKRRLSDHAAAAEASVAKMRESFEKSSTARSGMFSALAQMKLKLNMA